MQITSMVTDPTAVTKSNMLHKKGRLILAIFLFGMFIDYGGSFGIKIIAGLLALGWVLLQKRSFAILRRRRLDILVLLGVPTLLSMFHLVFYLTDVAGKGELLHYAVRYYNTISSPALILLFPLFYLAGTQIVLRQMRVGFRILAVAILLAFALQVAGIINLNNYDLRRIGYIGLDPRLTTVPSNQQGVLAPFIAFAMPLIIGYEMATSVVGATVMFLSLLVVGSRGLLLGFVLLVVLWLFFSLEKSQRKRMLFRIGVFVLLAFAIIWYIEPIRFRVTGVFVKRATDMLRSEDVSTQARLGHLKGYWNLIKNEPLKFFFGAGPTGTIYNPFYADFLGESAAIVAATEMSLLNLAIYYGVPFSLLYVFWLYRGAWKLWRMRKTPGFRKSDLGLLLGTAIFWMMGNTNPQMTGPFAIMAYMLLVVRTAELKNFVPDASAP